MNEASIPPPPPLGASSVPTADPELAAALESMAATVQQAFDDLEAQRIGLEEFQSVCLDAGIVRVGGVAFIWDWINEVMYGYDGMEVVVLDTAAPPGEPEPAP